MDKLQYDKNEVKKNYIENYGNFNTMPIPNKEVDISEFWGYFFTWSPEGIDFKQVVIDGIFRNIKIYIYHDTAFALVRMKHKEAPRVYRIGCEHKWVEKNIGKCLHQYTCTLCGNSQTVDSSD
jgi:hypothetical protein